MGEDRKYRLAPGTQVRDEDFGLLFYTMSGPRLYFLRCGRLMGSSFFTSRMSLGKWLEQQTFVSEAERLGLMRGLTRLREKGVILEF